MKDFDDVFDEFGCVGGCFMILLALGILAGIFILLGWLFSLLWNFAMPHIFTNAPIINIWIGTAIVIMARILFGSFLNTKDKNK